MVFACVLLLEVRLFISNPTKGVHFASIQSGCGTNSRHPFWINYKTPNKTGYKSILKLLFSGKLFTLVTKSWVQILTLLLFLLLLMRITLLLVHKRHSLGWISLQNETEKLTQNALFEARKCSFKHVLT